MKLITYTDNHWSQYSSILRTRGKKYSTRLENEINSVNFAENLAIEEHADAIVINGDFFDKPELNAEELSALSDVKWAPVPHYILVGNHEMGLNDLSYSSAHLLKFIPMARLITKPTWIGTSLNTDTRLLFLPYILECNREPFKYYIEHATPMFDDTKSKYNKTIVFSHNDISGIRYGQYESKIGFNIKDITDNCDLYINGHLHNQEQINEKILNLGSLTGQNFSEDAEKYSHCVGIVNISNDNLSIDLVNNPYALNFYKFEIADESDIDKWNSKLKTNSILAIKTKETFVNNIKEIFKSNPNILEMRITIIPEMLDVESSCADLISIDHIKEFKSYILRELGSTETILEELELL